MADDKKPGRATIMRGDFLRPGRRPAREGADLVVSKEVIDAAGRIGVDLRPAREGDSDSKTTRWEYGVTPETAGAMVKIREIELEIARVDKEAKVTGAQEETRQAEQKATAIIKRAEARAKAIEHRYATPAIQQTRRSNQQTVRLAILGGVVLATVGPALWIAFAKLTAGLLVTALLGIVAVVSAVFGVAATRNAKPPLPLPPPEQPPDSSS